MLKGVCNDRERAESVSRCPFCSVGAEVLNVPDFLAISGPSKSLNASAPGGRIVVAGGGVGRLALAKGAAAADGGRLVAALTDGGEGVGVGRAAAANAAKVLLAPPIPGEVPAEAAARCSICSRCCSASVLGVLSCENGTNWLNGSAAAAGGRPATDPLPMAFGVAPKAPAVAELGAYGLNGRGGPCWAALAADGPVAAAVQFRSARSSMAFG